jgi:predicted  nucleic acid-binding Zn-ribbon protein
MPRWQPKTPIESMQTSLERLTARITAKKEELKELEEQKRQVEAAIKALSG